ncbi:MAG: hypothetical protein H7Y06_04160 [Opitutaceae bacterium]|nr:hypothetical protein [Opitutaceae bacterium]
MISACTFLRPWFASAVSVLAACAAFAAPPKPQPLQAVTLLLLNDTQRSDDTDTSSCSLETSQGVVSVALSRGLPQGPFLRPASSQLELFLNQPTPLPPGQSSLPPGTPAFTRVPLASSPVDESWRNILVLVSIDNNGRVRRIMPIDQSLPSLSPGRIAVVNFADRNVALKIGRAESVIPAKGRIQMSATTASGRAETVLYQSALEINGQWQRVESYGLTIKPKWRQLALILPNGEGIQIVMLPPASDDPPEPPPAAPL